MTQKVSVEELQSWLTEGRPVTILDVRPEEQRQDWYIPGSRHEDLYGRLHRDGPDAMEDLDLPANQPVVTVCAAGRTSMIAADGLSRLGHQTFSLEGGMNAWGHAWNTATANLESGVEVVQIRRIGKGCLSYLVASNGEAVVIDAALDPKVFRDLATARGLRIVAALDTHVHADHLSRSRSLAESLDIPLYLPAQERVTYRFSALVDGEQVPFGNTGLEVVSTPGHTWESCSYLLSDAVFTGDTLFIDGVGRPDLEATPEEAVRRARALHASLRRLTRLPDDVLVLPAHSSAPLGFEGNIWGASLASVRAATALLNLDEETFVARVTARIPPAPENHQRIVTLNEQGGYADDAAALEAGGNRCAGG